MPVANDVTVLLRAWREGDPSALERLLPLVETEIRRLARGYLARERRDHTLQTTALINEAFLRLAGVQKVQWNDRAHFIGVTARLMRRVLVDYARSRGRQKRGGAVVRVALDEVQISARTSSSYDLLALDDALHTLEGIEPRKARVIELRFFGGLSVAEAAEVLQVSEDTVKRDWRLARLWLLRELGSSKS